MGAINYLLVKPLNTHGSLIKTGICDVNFFQVIYTAMYV